MREADADPTSVPDVNLRQAVVLFAAPDRARSYLAEARSMVDACRTEQVPQGTARYQVLDGAPVAAADVVVIRKDVPGYELGTGEPTGQTDSFYTALVRHGDTVAILHTAPHENWGVDDPARFYELTQIFADRVAEWRGPVPG
jgi:hypothetical protein